MITKIVFGSKRNHPLYFMFSKNIKENGNTHKFQHPNAFTWQNIESFVNSTTGSIAALSHMYMKTRGFVTYQTRSVKAFVT